MGNTPKIKKYLLEGWELWYVPDQKYAHFGGSWELRKRNQKNISVPSHIIDSFRAKNKSWADKNLMSTDMGKGAWCYEFKQLKLKLNEPKKSFTP